MPINNHKNLIDEIVDKFIESVLKDRPIGAFDLEFELEDFLNDNKDIDTKNIQLPIQLVDESVGQQIHEELMQAHEFVSNPVQGENFDYNFDLDFLECLQKVDDPLIDRLANKIVRDKRVRIRELHELEERGLSDEYTENIWIFHKDNDYKTDLKYIIDFYDALNKEDQYFL